MGPREGSSRRRVASESGCLQRRALPLRVGVWAWGPRCEHSSHEGGKCYLGQLTAMKTKSSTVVRCATSHWTAQDRIPRAPGVPGLNSAVLPGLGLPRLIGPEPPRCFQESGGSYLSPRAVLLLFPCIRRQIVCGGQTTECIHCMITIVSSVTAKVASH